MIKTLKQKVLYENKWVKYHEDEVEFPNGEKGIYAYHERADSGPMIIPVTPEGKFLILKEWRYPIKDWTWCFPCGGVEAGESFLHSAQRELIEETGFTTSNWKNLGVLFVDPGGSSQTAPVFLAEDIVQNEELQKDGAEVSDIYFFTAEEIEEKIHSGEFNNAWLLSGWCKYKNFLKK